MFPSHDRQSPAQPTPQPAPQGQPSNDPNILQSFFNALPGGRHREAALKQRDLNNQLLEQELLGQKPLQKGEREKLQIAETKELAKSGQLTANQLFGRFEPLAVEFDKSSTALLKLEELVDSEASGPGDIGIIFQYMKILDPDSAVREGEQATVRDSTNIPDKIRNLYNRLIETGESLNPQQRKAIVSAARNTFKGTKKDFERQKRQFAELGRQSGINPNVFIRQVDLQSMSDEELFKIAGGE